MNEIMFVESSSWDCKVHFVLCLFSGFFQNGSTLMCAKNNTTTSSSTEYQILFHKNSSQKITLFLFYFFFQFKRMGSRGLPYVFVDDPRLLQRDTVYHEWSHLLTSTYTCVTCSTLKSHFMTLKRYSKKFYFL